MWLLLKEKRKIETSQDLISAVYQRDLDIASLAPVVIEAAENGDEVADGILSISAEDLCDHVAAILPQLDAPIPLVLGGSLLDSRNILSQKVRLNIQTRFPNLKIQEPNHPPAVGAALLAFKKPGPL